MHRIINEDAPHLLKDIVDNGHLSGASFSFMPQEKQQKSQDIIISQDF